MTLAPGCAGQTTPERRQIILQKLLSFIVIHVRANWDTGSVFSLDDICSNISAENLEFSWPETLLRCSCRNLISSNSDRAYRKFDEAYPSVTPVLMSCYEKPGRPFLRYPPVNYRQLPATPGHTVYNTTYSRIASTRSPAFGDQYYWRYSPEFEVLLGFPQSLLKSNSRNQLGHLPVNELLLEMGNSKLYYPIFQMRLFWKKQPYRFGVIPSNQILQLSIWVSSRQWNASIILCLRDVAAVMKHAFTSFRMSATKRTITFSTILYWSSTSHLLQAQAIRFERKFIPYSYSSCHLKKERKRMRTWHMKKTNQELQECFWVE